MADGDLSLGIVSAGSTQTSASDVIICSWTMPSNIIAKVEVNCIVQKVLDKTMKSSYVLIAMAVTLADMALITAGPTMIRIEESSAVMTITMDVSDNNLIIKTATSDGAFYRVSAFIDVCFVEQLISAP